MGKRPVLLALRSPILANRLPATTVRQLTPAGVKVATSPQILVNPTYHETVVRTAEGFARKFSVAQVPPGPQHDQIAASVATQAMQQVQHLLNQVFEALRLSLAFAIQHGLIAILVFCGAIILATFFLKDIPMTQQSSEVSDKAEAVVESVKDLSIYSLMNQ